MKIEKDALFLDREVTVVMFGGMMFTSIKFPPLVLEEPLKDSRSPDFKTWSRESLEQFAAESFAKLAKIELEKRTIFAIAEVNRKKFRSMQSRQPVE